ncbi:MAG: hypothetical protein RR090_09875 [Niameybacter sp.]|uniref:hypothetical protein n=1 Tax=Niameybacter sp. TaxID=2033640 RepID=UPI002FCBE9CE
MKHTQLFAIAGLTLCLTSIFFTGCSLSQPSDTHTPVTSPESLPKDTNTATLTSLTTLIGKSDTEMVALLGEGNASLLEDTTTVLGRDYLLDLFDTEILLSASLDEDGLIQAFTLLPSDNDLDTWNEQLTSLFGPAHSETSDDGSEGSGRKSFKWTIDNTSMTLKSVYETLSIEIYSL